MNSNSKKLLGILALSVLGSAIAPAQSDWGFECVDPENTAPRSNHLTIGRINALMGAFTGLSGTTTYGGQNGPCFGPTAFTLEIAGGFGFMCGSVGSVQDQNPADPTDIFQDDFMPYNFGMPTDPNRDGGIVLIDVDGQRTVWGSSGFGEFWAGQSGRYYHIGTTISNVTVNLRVDVIGDAAKLTWDLVNLDQAASHTIGLWFGLTMAMLSDLPDVNGATMSYSALGTLNPRGPKLGFSDNPTGRPIVVPQRFIRVNDPSNFPTHLNFLFGQTASYGIRLEMGPGTNSLMDATPVDEITVGDWDTSPNVFNKNGAPDGIIPDTENRIHTQVLQKYLPQTVPASGTRRIVQYVRTPWGNGNYEEPYTAVVDAPQLVASDPNGFEGLSPNPMTFRVYVDNAQGLAQAGQGISIQQARITLQFPNGGLALSAGEPMTKTINNINPGAMSAVDFSVESDGVTFGDIPYTVTIDPVVPSNPKTITGVVRVSSTPKIDIAVDANLIGMPWSVDDSSWEAVLGLKVPADFRAYKWDPQQNGYLISTSAERGIGTWIVSNADFGILDIQGNPTAPSDIATGAPYIQLKSGWNLISNPYPYAVALSQIIGVPAGQGIHTWAQLVASGYVSSSLAYYDNGLSDYVFVGGQDATLFPHRGYWIYVNTQNDVTLAYPPVFARGLPQSPRRAANENWIQSATKWRLQLAARTGKSQDSQNYVGYMQDRKDAKQSSLPEIPMSPVANVSLSIDGSPTGNPNRMSQSYADKVGRQVWKVFVTTTEGEQVTITWPNLSTVPKNVRFRLTDKATGTVRDLRNSSGYTFATDSAGVREFTLEMVPGGGVKATIGNVVVSKGRAPLSPYTVKYALSADAATTIRVLSSSGKEVYTIHRGHADRSGENSVQWGMRDNANRLVAPGSYRIEIIAETSDGERVRKIIPVNVIR